jgi:hypothetical protein
MKVNTLFALFNWVIGCSTKWLSHTTQIETPSRRFVRKLKPAPVQFIRGQGESKEMTMGRLEDPNFRYIPKAESEKPGYLERRMKIYREMVRGENQRVRPLSQKSDKGAGNNGQIPSKPDNCLQGTKLAVVRGKA